MTTSAPLCLAVALRSAGIRLGVSVNLFSYNCAGAQRQQSSLLA